MPRIRGATGGFAATLQYEPKGPFDGNTAQHDKKQKQSLGNLAFKASCEDAGMKTIKFQHWIVILAGLLAGLFSVIFVSTVFSRISEAARINATEKFALITQHLSQQINDEIGNATGTNSNETLSQQSSRLSTLLGQSTASDNAWIGLIDRQGLIITSHSWGQAPIVSSGDIGKPLSGQSDPLFKALSQTIKPLTANTSEFIRLDGASYLFSSASVSLKGYPGLNIVALAPEEDFTILVDEAKRFVLIITGFLVMLLIPLAIVATRGIARSLTDMTLEATRLRKVNFAAEPNPVHSPLQEINELASAQASTYQSIRERTRELETAKAKLGQIVETGVELGREKDNNILLQRALLGVRDVAHCEAATLFLKTDKDTLRFAVRTSDDELPTFELPLYDKDGSPMHRFVATHVALTGETVVIDDVYTETRFDLSGTKAFSEQSGMRVVSMLNVPLMPQKGKITGAIQLMNAKDPKTGEVIAFDSELVRFVEALAGLAAIALENKRLLDAQAALLDSMIQIMAGAIDTKSPYTGGHCERVPELATLLAEEACKADQGPLANFSFKNDEEWREFRIGAWLHDCGKVTTPEYVVDKATKLETIFNRIHEIRTRFEVLLRDADIDRLKAIYERGQSIQEADARFEARKAQLVSDFAFVAECNKGAEFMAGEKIERLHAISQQTWLRHFDDRLGVAQDELKLIQKEPFFDLPATEHLLSDKPRHRIQRPPSKALDERHGFKLGVPEYLYDRGEIHNLSIDRGTLTPEERFKINEHIIQTIVMLESMPLPSNLKRVPEYAGTHHETLTGTGYPRRLSAEALSIPSRIMAIADIFEALTASDRPYKETKTLSESIEILWTFKQNQHIDPDLFDLFLRSGVYLRYAEKFMRPDQIDEVDISKYLGANAAVH